MFCNKKNRKENRRGGKNLKISKKIKKNKIKIKFPHFVIKKKKEKNCKIMWKRVENNFNFFIFLFVLFSL